MSFFFRLILAFAVPFFSSVLVADQGSGIDVLFDGLAETYLESPTIISPGGSDDQELISSYFSSGQQRSNSATCENDEGYTVNFEDVSIISLLRFISEISNTNFVFDKQDLQFSITFVSEDPTTSQDLSAALLQILRMRGLSVLEQGNNVLIYKSETLAKVSTVITDNNIKDMEDTAIVTRVFKLYNLSASAIAGIVKPLLSKDASVEVSEQSQHVIVSDITANVEKIGDLIEALDVPHIQIEVGQYQVLNGTPSTLVAYAEKILEPLVAQNIPLQLIPQASSKTIYIVSTPLMIGKAQNILASLDTKDIAPELIEELKKADLPSSDIVNSNFFVYKLLYHEGKPIAEALNDIGASLQKGGLANMDLVNTINSMQWVKTNNSLVFSGTDKAINKVKELLADLDTPPKQVYIEVLIIDTSIGNSLDFGVEWVALGDEQNKLAYASGFLNDAPSTAPTASLTGQPQNPLYGGARTAAPPNFPPPNPVRGGAPGSGGDIPLGNGFGFGIVGNILRHNGQSFLTLGALVSALETESESTIVINPRILTEDNKEANFFVGENIPYQTTSTVIRDTGSVTENIQYEDVGVQLRITPFIGANNMVTLQIDQSVSEVDPERRTITAGTQVIIAPTTRKTLTTTRVHVPNDTFLVMSGHIREEKVYTKEGIPCLGSLPLLGPTFSRRSEARRKRNLILFIRPHIIASPREGVAFSNQEGYDFNWESNPASIKQCGTDRAPEAQTYPPSPCPDR